MQVWNVLHGACGSLKYRNAKNCQKFAICAPSHNFVGLYLRNWGTYWQSEKNLLNSNFSPTCPYNMVNFGSLAAEIVSLVWGTPANFNGFRILAALLHSTLVAGVSRTLQCWTEGAIYIWQGGHHVGHWPTLFCVVMHFFRVVKVCFCCVRFRFFHTKPRDGLGEHLRNDLFCVEWDVKP